MTNPIDETPSKPLGIAIYSPSGYPQCDYHLDNPYDIQITEIVATEKGWIAKGSGLDFPADRGDGATPGV